MGNRNGCSLFFEGPRYKLDKYQIKNLTIEECLVVKEIYYDMKVFSKCFD